MANPTTDDFSPGAPHNGLTIQHRIAKFLDRESDQFASGPRYVTPTRTRGLWAAIHYMSRHPTTYTTDQLHTAANLATASRGLVPMSDAELEYALSWIENGVDILLDQGVDPITGEPI